MKKLNLLVIMIMIMTFGTITNVKALSYDYTLGSQIRFIDEEKTINFEISNPNNSNNWKNYIVSFDYNIENQNAKFVRFTYAGQIQNIGNFTQNIVWNETCTERVDPTADFSIRFADNSTATISRTAYQTLCDLHKINGNITESTFDIKDFNFRVYLRSANGNWPPCEVDNGFILCPIENNKTYTGLVFRYYGNQSNMSFITYKMLLTNLIWTINTDAQNIINNQNQNATNINNNINNVNNTINDSNIDNNNTSSSTSEWNNKVASNGTITNLLTLPIQLMQGYVNGMNSSCTPFNLGNLFGTTIILPCINVGNLIGSSLWSVIDVLFSGFMIFGIAKKLIKIFNDFTNMKSNQVDELYGGGA